MEEKERIVTYITGIYILTFMEQWKKSEMIGAKAKIYNTIVKKHNVFHKQLVELKNKKREKVSKNCEIFIKASSFAIKSWDRAVKDSKGLTISVSTTIRNIYNLNKENITKIYGLKEDDFIKFDHLDGGGIKTFSSCKMGRILVDYAKEEIEQ